MERHRAAADRLSAASRMELRGDELDGNVHRELVADRLDLLADNCGRLQGEYEFHADSDTASDTDCNSRTDADSDSGADSDSDANSNSDADANRDAHADLDADSHGHAAGDDFADTRLYTDSRSADRKTSSACRFLSHPMEGVVAMSTRDLTSRAIARSGAAVGRIAGERMR
jgi:hypothetical protein